MANVDVNLDSTLDLYLFTNSFHSKFFKARSAHGQLLSYVYPQKTSTKFFLTKTNDQNRRDFEQPDTQKINNVFVMQKLTFNLMKIYNTKLSVFYLNFQADNRGR